MPPISPLPHPAVRSLTDDQIREQAQVFAARARSFYDRYGLGKEQGNGPVKFTLTRGLTSYNRITDRIEFGRTKTHDPHVFEDVVAHEYSHRIPDKAAGWPGITYVGQSGALAEGLADTLAAAIIAQDGADAERRALAELDPTGKTLDMGKRYGALPYPTKLSEYRNTWLYDNGGVHLNAGIVRRAHFLIAQRIGTGKMADAVMGAVLTDLRRSTNFRRWATANVEAAERLWGATSPDAAAVRDAWQAVGVLGVSPAPLPVPATA